MFAVLILGNQLFPKERYLEKIDGRKLEFVFMREDRELCAYQKFHKKKIVLFLAAMRAFRDELKTSGVHVRYESFDRHIEADRAEGSYEDALVDFLTKKKIKKIGFFEIEDKFFENRIRDAMTSAQIETEIWPSPMFLTSRDELDRLLGRGQRNSMRPFYENQRKRLKILIERDGAPKGGRWSFDTENRKPLPAKIRPPELGAGSSSPHIAAVADLCLREFSDHPGETTEFWLPIDHKGARTWLSRFVKERLEFFGPFEDAIPETSDFVYHSALSPLMNCGLLLPPEIVSEVLRQAKAKDLPIESVEGFIRQVIGWREFIHGIYRKFSEEQDQANHWKHERKLSEVWYKGDTGIPPLDNVIKKTLRFGYCHHIERLMVVGNLMLLCEVKPSEAHRWFMEMFVDSSDWVMGPNVYGMALFSDGGIFATKPYICGSNYYRKMGGYKAGPWCDAVDGLYWGFIGKHLEEFSRNPRMAMPARLYKAMDKAKIDRQKQAADKLRSLLVK